MTLLRRIRNSRQITAKLLLLWMLLSGSLFCTVHAGIVPDTSSTEVKHHCCHGANAKSSSMTAGCCDTPSSLCCGNAKQSATAPIEVEPVEQTVLFIVAIEVVLGMSLVDENPILPVWTEDIFLRRSDPPIHLRNCTFLD